MENLRELFRVERYGKTQRTLQGWRGVGKTQRKLDDRKMVEVVKTWNELRYRELRDWVGGRKRRHS